MTRLLVTIAILLALSACSDDKQDIGDGGGSVGDMNVNRDALPVNHDGPDYPRPDWDLLPETVDGFLSEGVAGKVSCTTSTCDVSMGAACCTFPAQCRQSACGQGSDRFECDGPEDCGNTPCCIDPSFLPSTASCSSTPVCASGFTAVCHADSDCAAGLLCCARYATNSTYVYGACLTTCAR